MPKSNVPVLYQAKYEKVSLPKLPESLDSSIKALSQSLLKARRRPGDPVIQDISALMKKANELLVKNPRLHFYGSGLGTSLRGISISYAKREYEVNNLPKSLGFAVNLGYWINYVLESRFMTSRISDYFSLAGTKASTVRVFDEFYGEIGGHAHPLDGKHMTVRDFILEWQKSINDNSAGKFAKYKLNAQIANGVEASYFKGGTNGSLGDSVDLSKIFYSIMLQYSGSIQEFTLDCGVSTVGFLGMLLMSLRDFTVTVDENTFTFEKVFLDDTTVSGYVIGSIISYLQTLTDLFLLNTPTDVSVDAAGRYEERSEAVPMEEVNLRDVLHDDDKLTRLWLQYMYWDRIEKSFAAAKDAMTVKACWGFVDEMGSDVKLKTAGYDGLVDYAIGSWLAGSPAFYMNVQAAVAMRNEMIKQRRVAVLPSDEIAAVGFPKPVSNVQGWLLGAKIRNAKGNAIDPIFGLERLQKAGDKLPCITLEPNQTVESFASFHSSYSQYIEYWNSMVERYFSPRTRAFQPAVSSRCFELNHLKTLYHFTFARPRVDQYFGYLVQTRPIHGGDEDESLVRIEKSFGVQRTTKTIPSIQDPCVNEPYHTYTRYATSQDKGKNRRTYCFYGVSYLSSNDIADWQDCFYNLEVVPQDTLKRSWLVVPSCKGYKLRPSIAGEVPGCLYINGAIYESGNIYACGEEIDNMFDIADPMELFLSIREEEYGRGDADQLQKIFNNKWLALNGSASSEAPLVREWRDPFYMFRKVTIHLGDQNIFDPMPNEVISTMRKKYYLPEGIEEARLNTKHGYQLTPYINRWIKVVIPFDKDSIPLNILKAYKKGKKVKIGDETRDAPIYPVAVDKSIPGLITVTVEQNGEPKSVEVPRFVVWDEPYPGAIGGAKDHILKAEMWLDVVKDLTLPQRSFVGYTRSGVQLRLNNPMDGLAASEPESYIFQIFNGGDEKYTDFLNVLPCTFNLGADLARPFVEVAKRAAVVLASLTPDSGKVDDSTTIKMNKLASSKAGDTLPFLKACSGYLHKNLDDQSQQNASWREAGAVTSETWGTVIATVDRLTKALTTISETKDTLGHEEYSELETAVREFLRVSGVSMVEIKNFVDYLTTIDSLFGLYNWDAAFERYGSLEKNPLVWRPFAVSTKADLYLSDFVNSYDAVYGKGSLDLTRAFLDHALRELFNQLVFKQVNVNNRNETIVSDLEVEA